MLLGDGSLPKPQKETHGVLMKITHAMDQKEYNLWKKSLLEYLTECRWVEDERNGEGQNVCRVITRKHPFYKSLREHLYHNGKRTVDEHVMKCLSPLGLALWYQDDGTIQLGNRSMTPMICSMAYNKVENEMMARMLHKKFGITFRVNKTTQKYKGEKRTYYFLRLRVKDRQKFFDIIKPYMHETMMYKMDTSRDCHNPKPLKEKIHKNCIVCGKEFSVYQCQMNGKKYPYKTCSRSCADKSRTNAWRAVNLTEDVLCSA